MDNKKLEEIISLKLNETMTYFNTIVYCLDDNINKYFILENIVFFIYFY